LCIGGTSGDRHSFDRPTARQPATRAGPLAELTEREREVLGLIAEGHSNQAIGGLLFLSHRTVETHIRPIFTKLGLEATPDYHRRVVAVLTYLRQG
jgi:serine/threonine-protein kinase